MIFLSLQNYSISPKYCHQYPKKMQKLPQISIHPLLFPFIFDKKPPFLFSSLLFFSSLLSVISFLFLISSFCHLFPSLSVISFLFFFSSLSVFFLFFFSLFSFSLRSVFHILAFAVLSLFFYCKMRWCLPCHCSKRFRRFATSRVLPALSPFKNTLFSAISPSQTSQNRIKSLSLPQKRKVLCD